MRVHLLVVAGLPLALAACAHRGPREFDVTPRGEEEQVAAPEAPAADLAGVWTFNARESTRPGQMGGGGRGGVGGPGGGPGGGFGGMPPGGGMGGRPGGRPGGPPGGPDSAGSPRARRLTIVQTDSSLTISRDEGRPLTLFFDGRAVWMQGRSSDEMIEMNGRWRRGRFEVRRMISDRRWVRESYELASRGSKLIVRIRASASEPGETAAQEMRRVYDRAAP